MKESLHSYMKVGTVLAMSFPEAAEEGEPFLRALREVAEDDFFSVVEMAKVKDPATRRSALQILALSRLEVGFSGGFALMTGRHNLNAFEEVKRKEAVQVAVAAYDEGREMGAQFFSLLSGVRPSDRREEALALLVQSLREICAHAEERGNIPIVLETFDCEIEKRCLIGPSIDALRVANEVGKDYAAFSLMLDLSHLPLLNEKPAESLRVVKGRIGHIHLGNCVLRDRGHLAYGDSHPPFGISGGENDVDEVADFFRGLLEVGYLKEGQRPRISLEIRPRPGDDADAILAGSKRVLLDAWARV
jgi:sugar phosphate isomerase/epimerase